ncbi:thiamine pyrophosphate-binding protein [Aquabacter spiritensis]|uniref:Acetolactate synthase-1/2/3 large subunit n=1 Tax=Aquabacter spiritensis TaxID=933073 RepID=A0A4R3LRT1_9HYPH|nr:thiamine pyrophosphate-binding protein [Aquabacter spiritensis]TCT03233.1 acetolactate synthase-1/2/3 large subunit [Aquabacter spiritensis]
MTSPHAPRTGGQLIVDQLIAQKVERLTCVPGESYLAVLDALHDAAIDVLVCRNEGGAAMMADAYGKMTGRPGICFVTRGPGATNASPGIHIAAQDSTPLILFVGQVERGMRGREAFQELDYRAVFGSIAKWVVEIEDAARIPELVARAFRVALQGRPGPVVVALPEDVLTDTASVADAPYVEPAAPAPAPADVARLGEMLRAAERPLMILGGTRWTDAARADLAAVAARCALPIATSFRRADRFPSDHPCYVGDVGIGPNPKLAARVKTADLLILLGARMSEMPSSAYTLIDIPNPRQRLVHVHSGAEELGRVYQPELAIEATPGTFAAALAAVPDLPQGRWEETTGAGHADFLAWTESPADLPGDFQYGAAIAALRDRLPADCIICNGAGNYATWIHRYFRFRTGGIQLAPTSGSMGYGIPAGVMAKRQFPDRTVVAFAGDGCYLMNGQEFATAVQYGVPVINIVVDNGMYGTIRMHQEREYPGRVSASTLRNPDFAAYARAFGGHGETVLRTEDFLPAFARAQASGLPAILHCKLDPEALTPMRTLSAIRQEALDRHGG